MNAMEIKELKEKIISELIDADKKDLFEEILFLLNKKRKIFTEDENLKD